MLLQYIRVQFHYNQTSEVLLLAAKASPHRTIVPHNAVGNRVKCNKICIEFLNFTMAEDCT